jgi:hypothetical protein
VYAPAAEVARRLGDSPGDLTPAGEQACRLHSHADTLEWLAFRLMLLGCEFEVHQPPELAGYLRTLGVRLTRAAGPLSLQLADRGEAVVAIPAAIAASPGGGWRHEGLFRPLRFDRQLSTG